MRFLFPQVLTSCHIINYGSKHALNTQRKAFVNEKHTAYFIEYQLYRAIPRLQPAPR